MAKSSITRGQIFHLPIAAVTQNQVIRVPSSGGQSVPTNLGFNSVEIVINLLDAEKIVLGNSLSVALFTIVSGVDTFVSGFPDSNLGNYPGSQPYRSRSGNWTVTDPFGTVLPDPDPAFMINITSLGGNQICIKYYSSGFTQAGVTVNGIS